MPWSQFIFVLNLSPSDDSFSCSSWKRSLWKSSGTSYWRRRWYIYQHKRWRWGKYYNYVTVPGENLYCDCIAIFVLMNSRSVKGGAYTCFIHNWCIFTDNWCIFTMFMSPTLNRHSVMHCSECSNVINRVMLKFYMGLPLMWHTAEGRLVLLIWIWVSLLFNCEEIQYLSGYYKPQEVDQSRISWGVP